MWNRSYFQSLSHYLQQTKFITVPIRFRDVNENHLSSHHQQLCCTWSSRWGRRVTWSNGFIATMYVSQRLECSGTSGNVNHQARGSNETCTVNFTMNVTRRQKLRRELSWFVSSEKNDCSRRRSLRVKFVVWKRLSPIFTAWQSIGDVHDDCWHPLRFAEQ